MMMKLKCEVVMDGPGPNEQIVRVRAADGHTEDVVAHRSSVQNGLLETSRALARDGGRVLVELPRESTAGNWRLWVPHTELQP